MILKNFHLILCIKNSDFHKKITRLKKLTPEIKENKDLKVKVLGNAGDLFNELYYIYKKDMKKKKIL